MPKMIMKYHLMPGSSFTIETETEYDGGSSQFMVHPVCALSIKIAEMFKDDMELEIIMKR